MEEIEVPLESTQESINEAAHHAKESWISKTALFSAIVAVIAALASLLAGHHSNEAMISQIKASDSWSYYQAKGVKAAILENKMQVLASLGKSHQGDQEKLDQYKQQQEEISEKSEELQKESEHHLKIHEILARAVTLFQVAIAITAITVLTRRKRFMLVSFGFSLIAVIFFIQALIQP
ncbi:MAG: DUF4337 domain-containing protein [Bdellovibrio sp.]|nr:DUF4337 domain-containing protein [Bdellovibrio sp.]